MAGTIDVELKRARMLAGLSQDELASQLGVTRKTLGNWERSGQAPTSRIRDLRAILGDNLPGGDEPAAPGEGKPMEFVIDGTRIVVYPDPDLTPEQVRGRARAIFEASMEAIARDAENVTGQDVGHS